MRGKGGKGFFAILRQQNVIDLCFQNGVGQLADTIMFVGEQDRFGPAGKR